MKHDWRGKRFCPYTWELKQPPYQTYGVFDNKTGIKVVTDLEEYDRAIQIASRMNKDLEVEGD
jgi:hypothetical protein